jgi:metal-responsive CopG/Arc/MetJ family transcriptional regulator
MPTHHRSPDIATLTISLPKDLLAAVDRRTTDLSYLSRSSYVCNLLRNALEVPEFQIPPRSRTKRRRTL